MDGGIIMKKSFRILNVRMYDYKLLEKYLNEMAKKGWHLISFHSFLTGLMVFEKREETNTRYMVDYYKTQKYFDMNEEEKMKEYHMLVEQYGYQYILSWNYIQIYQVVSENAMMIHDDTSEAGMYENVKQYLKDKVLFTMFSIIVLFLSERGRLWNFLLITILCQIYIEIPYIHYMIRRHETKSLIALKCDTIISLFLALFFVMIFLWEAPLLGSMILVCSIGYVLYQEKYQKKQKGINQ